MTSISEILISKQLPATSIQQTVWEPQMGLSPNGSISFFKTQEQEALAERSYFIREAPGDYIFCLREAKSAVEELASLLNLSHALNKETLLYQKLCRLSEHVETDLLFVNPMTKKVIAEAVCFPTKWKPEDKIDKSVLQAHESVPAMSLPSDNINIAIDRLLERLNPYSVKDDKGIYLRANIGFSQTNERNLHPNRRIPSNLDLSDIKNCYVRVEEQALMKLPQTEVVIFAIRIKHTKLKSFQNKDGLVHMLKTMSPEMLNYKNISIRARDSLIEELINSEETAR